MPCNFDTWRRQVFEWLSVAVDGDFAVRNPGRDDVQYCSTGERSEERMAGCRLYAFEYYRAEMCADLDNI